MVNELIEKRKRLHEENSALLAKAQKDGRDVLTADEETEWQGRDAAIEAISKNIVMRTKQEKIEKALAEVADEPKAHRSADPTNIDDPRTSEGAMRQVRRGQVDLDMALRAWFLRDRARPEYVKAAERVGMNLRSNTLEFNLSSRAPKNLAEVREWERRGTDPQSVTTTTAGGYTVPDELMRAIDKALLWFGGVRQAADVIRTETGADLPFPTVNDTSNKGAVLNENTQVTVGDVTFSQVVLKSFKYTSKEVLVSVELMQDSATNMPALLGELLGERIGRIQNEHFTTGGGTTVPWGIVTRAAAGPTAGGTASAGFTYANFVDLEHSVDRAYRAQGAGFMMNDLVVARIKKLVDDHGRPIWQPANTASAIDGFGSTLLGYPVHVNNDMTTATTNGSKAILFGALNKYKVRDVLGITLLRLDERYADYHQVAFLAFARADGDLINAGTSPIKYLSYQT
jgi:HK97 family phage major capsid protein